MRPPAPVVGCFGKVPARSDFIRASTNPPVVSMLDRWLAQAMRLLAAEPRWKILYDAMGPVSFAFVGTHRRYAIVGHLAPSHDQAGRRFPLLLMSALDIGGDTYFLPSSPVALGPAWRHLAHIATELRTRDDTEAVLERYAELPGHVLPDVAAASAILNGFASVQSLGAFNRSLAQGGYPESARNLLLALGLLLRPVSVSRCDTLENCLRMPLPPADRAPAAGYLLSLIAPFVADGDFELALLLPHERNEMIVGFSGAAPRTLQALIDPRSAGDGVVGFDDCAWIAAAIDERPYLPRLACLLDQPNLPLASARGHCDSAFLGG
jgi:type VI secretion system protein ImpM